jgi:hypothetical protein
MLLAETDNRVVGLRAFMRWRFMIGDRELTAVRAVDTATHPQYQGQGIFSRLTLTAIELLRGEADVVFNTPNEKSLPGYLKMGWSIAGSVPIGLRVRRPIRFARHARSLRGRVVAGSAPPPEVAAAPAFEALHNAGGLSVLLRRVDSWPGRIATQRSIEYLRWRYGTAPLLDYRAVVHDDGIAIFRVRQRGALWETTFSELLVDRGNFAAARRLMGSVARSARTDYVTFSFPVSSAVERASRRWSVRAPSGMTLAVNTFNRNLDPDPTQLASWALSLGDLEVF